MKSSHQPLHMGTGILSLIMIFVVLCMAIVSTLSYLSASQSEQLIDKEIDQSTRTYQTEAVATELYYLIDEYRTLDVEEIMQLTEIQTIIQKYNIPWTLENDILNISIPIQKEFILKLKLKVQTTSTDILFWSMIKEDPQ